MIKKGVITGSKRVPTLNAICADKNLLSDISEQLNPALERSIE